MVTIHFPGHVSRPGGLNVSDRERTGRSTTVVPLLAVFLAVTRRGTARTQNGWAVPTFVVEVAILGTKPRQAASLMAVSTRELP